MRRLKFESETLPRDLPGRVTATTEQHHYLVDVLRIVVGEEIELFDGAGHAWRATVVSTQPLELDVSSEVTVQVESPLEITIYQAIPKGDRWEWFLEKATELGVDTICPIVTSRSVVVIPAVKVDRKLERWQRIVDGAARQSGRTKTPIVRAPMELSDHLRMPLHGVHFVADPYCGVENVIEINSLSTSATADVSAWVGPEGGFTPEEMEKLYGAGARSMSFGPRILRSETAGVYAVAKLQILLGDG